MNFDFAGQSFPVEGWPNESLLHLVWSPPFKFNQSPLLNDVSHFLLLLLSLVCFFFQVGDLLDQTVESMSVWRAIRYGSDERSIGILEWLHKSSETESSKGKQTDSVLLFTSQLTRGLEIDSEVSEIAFVVLTRILDGINMKRDSEAVNGQNYCLCFAIDEYLRYELATGRAERE